MYKTMYLYVSLTVVGVVCAGEMPLCLKGCWREYSGDDIQVERKRQDNLPLYFWRSDSFLNFGDYLSIKLVERIVGGDVLIAGKNDGKKLLAIGSILQFARQHDVLWGSGVNGKHLKKQDYAFNTLDVRAVRGPITRQFLRDTFGMQVPEVYGDPALLFPYFFPEFKPSEHPAFDYVLMVRRSEEKLFPKDKYPQVIYSSDPWDEVVHKILDSKFVISSALHGIIIAESYGIPARLVRFNQQEPLCKFIDYYLGTHRVQFEYANSVEQALAMGGEEPACADLVALYKAFPFDCYQHSSRNENFLNDVTQQVGQHGGCCNLRQLYQAYLLNRVRVPSSRLDLQQSQDCVVETKRIEIPDYPLIFNPSITRWRDKFLMSFRIRNGIYTHQIGLVWLDDTFNPLGKPCILRINYQEQLPVNMAHNSPLQEQDPRLVTIGDTLYIVYSHIKVGKMFVSRVAYENGEFVAYDPEYFTHFEGSSLTHREKNWVPFDYNRGLLLGYSILPHKILQPIFGEKRCETFAVTETPFSWQWGELRGGTPALKMDNHYLAFFHSSAKVASPHHKDKVFHYFMGAYAFNAHPPFAVQEVSPKPLIADTFYEKHEYQLYKPLQAIFPCGYVANDKYIWVFYGRHDNEAWYVKFDRKKLYKSLVSVA